MDNLTHSLTGFALARAGLDRLAPRATALLILSANAPDVDIIALLQGRFRYFEVHRGYSHSVLSLPVLAVLSVLVIAAVFRQRLPWSKAWLLCSVGVLSHLVIDWTNNYGVRLLLPFTSRWFHLDLNSLYDVWILAALLFAVAWPVFARLVSSEIGERPHLGRGPARFALAFFLLFDLGKALLHGRAIAQLDARLYDGLPPVRTAAFPNPFNPFVWNGVVETEPAYLTVPMNVLGELSGEENRTYFKPPLSAIERAASEAEFRYFTYFARFPVWSIAPVPLKDGEGKRLELTDLRFGAPGAGSFHCIALEDPRGRVKGAWFTYGSGSELGWSAQDAGNSATR
ncbi:MAG: metal-dependent hydrolase [Candidatus Udaeobacter sp.]